MADACDAEKQGIEKRLEDSDKSLTELLGDGMELITNIRIANDKREVDRRNKEAELREGIFISLSSSISPITFQFEIFQNFCRSYKMNH